MTRQRFQNNIHNSQNTKAFDYTQKGEILKRSVSSAFYNNKVLSAFLDHLSTLISHLVDSVKHIKRHYMYSVEPDEMNIE